MCTAVGTPTVHVYSSRNTYGRTAVVSEAGSNQVLPSSQRLLVSCHDNHYNVIVIYKFCNVILLISSYIVRKGIIPIIDTVAMVI